MNKLKEYVAQSYLQPKEIHLESSSRCNGCCITCPRQGMTRFQGEMSTKLFVKAINEVKEAGWRLEYCHFHLNGEPLFLPIGELCWRINYAKEHLPGNPVLCFFTNASLLNEDVAKRLLESQLSKIVFSVDGGTKKAFEDMRPGLKWEEVVHNISNFMRLKKQMSSTLLTQTAFIPCSINEYSLPAYYKLFKSFGIDDVGGSGVNNIGGHIDAKSLRLPAQYTKGHRKNPCWKVFNDLSICADGSAVVCCFPRNTLISTKYGLKNIQNIIKDDYVIGHDLRSHKVIRTFKRQYNGNYIKFQAVNILDETKVTENHPIYIVKKEHTYHFKNYKKIKKRKSKLKEFGPQWIKAKDIREGDYIVSGANKFTIKNNISDEELFIYGLYLGDGWVNHPKKGKQYLQFCFGFNKENLVDKVKDFFEKNLRLKVYTYKTQHNHQYNIRIKDEKLAKKYEKMFKTGCSNKIIPKELMQIPIDKLMIIVNGILKSDGYYNIKNNKVTIELTSQRLIQQIFYILINNGIRPSGGITKRINRRTSYYVTFYVNRTFNSSRSIKTIDNYYLCPIKEITKGHCSQIVYNFEVDKVNSYIANNIIVHNCQDVRGDLVLGDLNTQTVKDIWQGDYFEIVRKNHLAMTQENIALCKDCDYMESFVIDDGLKGWWPQYESAPSKP